MAHGEVDDDVDRLGEGLGEVELVGGGSDLDAEVVGAVRDDAEDVVAPRRRPGRSG